LSLLSLKLNSEPLGFALCAAELARRLVTK
jgi:hypothetical protein